MRREEVNCAKAGGEQNGRTVNHDATIPLRTPFQQDLKGKEDFLLRQAMLRLLAVKDSDIRVLTLQQSRDAVDRGLHAGGAFSATIPLVALFGPTNPERNGPRGPGDKMVLRDPASVTSYKRSSAEDPGMAKISVSAVVEAVQRLL